MHRWKPKSRLLLVLPIIAMLAGFLLALYFWIGASGMDAYLRFFGWWASSVFGINFFLPALQAQRKLLEEFAVFAHGRGIEVDSRDRLSIKWEETAKIRRLAFAPGCAKGYLNCVLFNLQNINAGPAVVVDAAPEGGGRVWFLLEVAKADGLDLGRMYRPGFYYIGISAKKSREFESAVKKYAKNKVGEKVFDEKMLSGLLKKA